MGVFSKHLDIRGPVSGITSLAGRHIDFAFPDQKGNQILGRSVCKYSSTL